MTPTLGSVLWLLLIMNLTIPPTDSGHETEDFVIIKEYTLEEKTYFTNIRKSSVHKCQRTSDILLVKIKISHETQDQYRGPDMTTWSEYMNDFVFEVEQEEDVKELERSFEKNERYTIALFGTLIIVLIFPLGFVVAMFALPLISMVFFRIGVLLWKIMFASPIRRVIRFFCILSEKLHRWKERLTQPFVLNLKQTRKHYYLPDMLREYSDEDEPSELKRIQGTISVMVEESSSDIEEDLIYHEFFRPDVYKARPVDQEMMWELTQDEILQVTKKDRVSKLKKQFKYSNAVEDIWKKDTEYHRIREIAKVRNQRQRLKKAFGPGKWGRVQVKQTKKLFKEKQRALKLKEKQSKTSSEETFGNLDAAAETFGKYSQPKILLTKSDIDKTHIDEP